MKHSGRRVDVHVDLCLCGSGRLLRDCCLMVRRDTRPPGKPTGFSHPSCFARELRDCDETISREHYISESLLRLGGGNRVTAVGLPWIPPGGKATVSIASLTGKVLCKRHNEALSPLDAVATQFFRFFTDEWTSEGVDLYLTSGHELERWLLKTLCGLVCSGNATLHGEKKTHWTPPRPWLDILFGESKAESPAGLHFIVATTYQAQKGMAIVSPQFKEATGQPVALAFALSGIGFMFCMEELPPTRVPSKTGADTRYRPMGLQLRRGEAIREAHFGWPDGQFVSIRTH